MNVMVILGNPNPASFNHAIAKTVKKTLTAMGHNVFFHDLYQEKFDPVLPLSEMQTLTDPTIRLHTEELSNADGLIIIHPIWRGMPPAIVCGWVDRVFRAGVAYRFQEISPGIGIPLGLLKAKKSVIFNTSNTPQDQEELHCKDAMENLWKVCILDTVGIKTVERKLFSPMMISTQQQREAWLKEAADIVKKVFSN